MINRLVFALSFIAIVACSGTQAGDSYGDDRSAIENLMARYSHALDFRDPEAFASTFAPDGIFQWARGEVKGRTAIFNWLNSDVYDQASKAEKGKWPAAIRHFVTNQAIEVNGNEAKAVSYWFQLSNPTASRKETKILLFGHYEDKLVKIDGKWYFKYRNVFNEGLDGRAKAGMPNPSW